jgi:hypothetical protein
VPEENTREFLAGTLKFGNVLTEAVNSLKGGIELSMPDDAYVTQFGPGPFSAAVSDAEASKHMEECLLDWCKQTEDLLAESNRINEGVDSAIVQQHNTDLQSQQQSPCCLTSKCGRNSTSFLLHVTCMLFHVTCCGSWNVF